MRKLIFATNNAHKLGEVQALLGDAFTLVTLRECGITEDIPETADTLEGNALQKARYVYEKTGSNNAIKHTIIQSKSNTLLGTEDL